MHDDDDAYDCGYCSRMIKYYNIEVGEGLWLEGWLHVESWAQNVPVTLSDLREDCLKNEVELMDGGDDC